MQCVDKARVRQRRQRLSAGFWILVYLLLIASPLIVLLLRARPIKRELLRELSVLLAFVGLGLMGLQFASTARLPFLARVFDLDSFYAFHHKLSLVSFVLILAHPVLLFVNNPYTLRLLNVLSAPWRARAAVGATVALLALIAMSVWRKPLEIAYDRWHVWHDLFSLFATGLALYHVFRVNYYTSDSVLRMLWIALAGLWGATLLYARIVRPWILARRPYQVEQVIQESDQAWTLVLAPVGHRGVRFLPGQIAWLKIWQSPFVLEHHPFSFASSAERTEQIEFTIKELGDWTAQVGEVEVGQRVYVDGPYGIFSPDVHAAPAYVFLAGGIGSAPILSMLRTFADRGDDRPLFFFYGSPTWEGVIYREQIEALKARLNLEVIHVLEHPPEGWEGETGYITRQVLVRYLPDDRRDLQYLISGPLPMIDSVERSLRELGIPDTNVQSEKYEMA
jgi:predicted ferric reductase